MALNKRVNGRKKESREPFIKLNNDCASLNVLATYLIGENTRIVDVLFDEETDEIAIVPNEQEGEYHLTPLRSTRRKVCLHKLLANNKDIDTNQRYIVEKYENGIKFKIQRIQWKEEKDGRG